MQGPHLNASHSEVPLFQAPILDTASSYGQHQKYKHEINSSMSEGAGYPDAHRLSQALYYGQASAYAQRSPSPPPGSIQSPISYPNSYSFVQQHSNGSMLSQQKPKASTHSSWRPTEYGYSLPNGRTHSYGLHASVQENTAGAPYRQGKTLLPDFPCQQIPTAQLQLMSLGHSSITNLSHGDALKFSMDGLAHQRLPSAQRQSLPRVPRNVDILQKKLQQIMQAHQLQSFYDPQKYQAVLQKVSCIDFCDIAARMKIGIELAYDLAPLALYDIVFFCDDSGSMAFEENGDRLDDLRYILSKVSTKPILVNVETDNYFFLILSTNKAIDNVKELE
ncbi:hypothetical protein KP509_11G014000 [Ceratopteris richardii]|uniref:Uncharacterized protein n=1 Tax=Ceratopteris richardii TaxID=49495 RepID=A0A8T2TT14_CERRI|nr:hypothetical protein KP509_11G014000 [Ceratopteris richardii]